MPIHGLICSHCNDASEIVSPLNGSTLLASTLNGEVIVALHTRCEGLWAETNDCRTLIPLKAATHAAWSSNDGCTPAGFLTRSAPVLGDTVLWYRRFCQFRPSKIGTIHL